MVLLIVHVNVHDWYTYCTSIKYQRIYVRCFTQIKHYFDTFLIAFFHQMRNSTSLITFLSNL